MHATRIAQQHSASFFPSNIKLLTHISPGSAFYTLHFVYLVFMRFVSCLQQTDITSPHSIN